MRAHPAGPQHAEKLLPTTTIGPLPGSAGEQDELPGHVWPRGISRDERGALSFAGVSAIDLAENHATPLFVVDEADFRSRAAEYAAAFGEPARVHYAAKAFLCARVARWVAEEGLSLDVCSGAELSLACSAGFPPGRVAFHGNNKSVAELAAAVAAGVDTVVLDSHLEIARLDAAAREAGAVQKVMVRVTVGVEAHTHEFIATAHEDQKFGFSLASGEAAEAVRRVLKADGLELAGLHSHIGSQIYDVHGFEVSAHRVMALLAELHDEHGAAALGALCTVDLGGGLGIAYVATDDPPSPAWLAEQLQAIVAKEARQAGLEIPRIAVEPGRAIAGPGTVTLYEVGTVKDVELDAGAVRRYVSVDGGMSDNIRTSLYDAVYDVRMASRRAEAEPVA